MQRQQENEDNWLKVARLTPLTVSNLEFQHEKVNVRECQEFAESRLLANYPGLWDPFKK